MPCFSASSTDIELGDVREMMTNAPSLRDFCIISELIRPVVRIIRCSSGMFSIKAIPAILSNVLWRPISSAEIMLLFPSDKQDFSVA